MEKQAEIEQLRALAKKYVNKKGYARIEEYISGGRMDLVKTYLLGTIEPICENGNIPVSEANELYQILGFSLK